MSSSKRSGSRRFLWLSVAIIAAFVGVLTVASTVITGYLRSRAAAHAVLASQIQDMGQKVSQLELAQALDPGNPAYRNQLADLYLQNGQLAQAAAALGDTVGERIRKAGLLMQLGRFNEGLAALQGLTGAEAAVARSRIYLEQGSGDRAITAVKEGLSDDALTQLGFSYAVAGQEGQLAPLAAKARSAAAKKTLKQAGFGGLTLAEALYGAKLYATAARVLQTASDASTASYTLLAQAYLSQLPSTKARLVAAQTAASQAVTINPSDPSSHELLRDIDTALQDKSGAQFQTDLIRGLLAGTP